jgi:hypothetical protein
LLETFPNSKFPGGSSANSAAGKTLVLTGIAAIGSAQLVRPISEKEKNASSGPNPIWKTKKF